MLKIKIPGYTIAYKTFGNPSNPPMLALHGWLDNANSFELIAPFLAQKFYLIAIDLPGHGCSSHIPEGCYYHFIDGIFILQNVFQALGYPKVHLLGHSMGACLASLCAGIMNEKILSLSLIEGLGPLSAPEESCPEQLSNYLKHSEQILRKPVICYENIELGALARAKRGHISIELAAILCQRGMEKKNEGYYWRHDPRLLYPSPLRMTERQVLSCLANITAPSRLVLAKSGFFLSPAIGSVDNRSKTRTTATCRGSSAASMDPADKPRDAGLSLKYQQTLMQNRINTVEGLELFFIEGGHHLHMEKPYEVAMLLL